MTDEEFDTALLAAVFALAAQDGWGAVSVAAAARAAGLDLARARGRFAHERAILRAFGDQADRAALTGHVADAGQPPQEQLFDMLMRRVDTLQAYRAGVLALFRALPADPATAFMLAACTRNSMRWILQAAGLDAGGPLGEARVQGLVGVWLWTIRSWMKDETADLSATMAALDAALNRAAQIARALPFQPQAIEAAPAPEDFPDPAPE